MGFGTALMKKLKQENMTLKELSEKTGIPTGTLYPIARGEEDPTMDIVARIDKAFRERFTDYDEDIFILKTGLEIKETTPHLVKAYEPAIVAMQELQQYKRLGDLKKFEMRSNGEKQNHRCITEIQKTAKLNAHIVGKAYGT